MYKSYKMFSGKEHEKCKKQAVFSEKFLQLISITAGDEWKKLKKVDATSEFKMAPPQ